MSFPSNVKLHMALDANPHYHTFSRITARTKRIFNAPTKLRKYSSTDAVILIPFSDVLTATEMDEMLSAIGRVACGVEPDNKILIDMVNFLHAETGLSVGILLSDAEGKRNTIAYTEGDYSSYHADLGSVMARLAAGDRLVFGFAIGPRPMAYK